MTKILLNITILFLLTSCHQNEKTDFESGILWKIESKSGTESFIFGTIHLYPQTEMELSENVISKLQECNVLALETDIADQSEQQKLADFQMPSFLLESYRVIIAEYGDELISMEGELMEKALESKMHLTGLESTDEILGIMKTVAAMKIPENPLTEEKILDEYQEGLKLYKTESIGKCYQHITNQMGEEITKTLVDNRNENWIDDIELLIDKDMTFIAIGMGHLGGRNGILSRLREKGYKLEPIGMDNTPPNIGYSK